MVKEEFDIRDMQYKRAKGILAKYVARGNRTPEVVAKTIHTDTRKGRLSQEDIRKLLGEVEEQTLALGENSSRLAAQIPTRLERLETVKAMLLRL